MPRVGSPPGTDVFEHEPELALGADLVELVVPRNPAGAARGSHASSWRPATVRVRAARGGRGDACRRTPVSCGDQAVADNSSGARPFSAFVRDVPRTGVSSTWRTSTRRRARQVRAAVWDLRLRRRGIPGRGGHAGVGWVKGGHLLWWDARRLRATPLERTLLLSPHQHTAPLTAGAQDADSASWPDALACAAHLRTSARGQRSVGVPGGNRVGSGGGMHGFHGAGARL
jgi:hypothetical protein